MLGLLERVLPVSSAEPRRIQAILIDPGLLLSNADPEWILSHKGKENIYID